MAGHYAHVREVTCFSSDKRRRLAPFPANKDLATCRRFGNIGLAGRPGNRTSRPLLLECAPLLSLCKDRINGYQSLASFAKKTLCR
jgi:hypothetical protein